MVMYLISINRNISDALSSGQHSSIRFMDIHLLTGFVESPMSLQTGPNANRVPQNIAGIDNTGKLACSTTTLNCRTYSDGSQVHNVGTSFGAKIVTQNTDYSVQLPLSEQKKHAYNTV